MAILGADTIRMVQIRMTTAMAKRVCYYLLAIGFLDAVTMIACIWAHGLSGLLSGVLFGTGITLVAAVSLLVVELAMYTP